MQNHIGLPGILTCHVSVSKEYVGFSRINQTSDIGPVRPHDDVIISVSIHISGPGDPNAELITRGLSGQHHIREVVYAGAAIVNIGPAGVRAAPVISISPHNDVVVTIPVYITCHRDRSAKLIIRDLAGQDHIWNIVHVIIEIRICIVSPKIYICAAGILSTRIIEKSPYGHICIPIVIHITSTSDRDTKPVFSGLACEHHIRRGVRPAGAPMIDKNPASILSPSIIFIRPHNHIVKAITVYVT